MTCTGARAPFLAAAKRRLAGAYTVVCRHGQTHFGKYQRSDLKSLLLIAETVSLDAMQLDGIAGDRPDAQNVLGVPGPSRAVAQAKII
ncbi:hypothetical protein CUJ87_22635 [Paraburkholderia caledonica]|nr:hypothetical protein CUJ87_22635 [Paraburkholderia caledonica]